MTDPIALLEEIERLSKLGGRRDDETLGLIKRHLFSLRCHRNAFGYIREKLGQIETYSEILFSVRKHQRYGGVEQVRVRILSACSSAEGAFRAAARAPDEDLGRAAAVNEADVDAAIARWREDAPPELADLLDAAPAPPTSEQ